MEVRHPGAEPGAGSAAHYGMTVALGAVIRAFCRRLRPVFKLISYTRQSRARFSQDDFLDDQDGEKMVFMTPASDIQINQKKEKWVLWIKCASLLF